MSKRTDTSKNPTSPKPRRRSFLTSRFINHDVGGTLAGILDLLVVCGLFIAINVAVSRPGCSWNHRGDWTAFSDAKRVFALSPKTVKYLGELNKPVTVLVLYAPPQGQKDYAVAESVKELLTRMERRTRYLRVKNVNVVSEPFKAKKLLNKYKVKTDPDAFTNPTIGGTGGGQVFFISDKRKKSVSFNDIATYALKKEKRKDQAKNRSKKPQTADFRLQYFSGEEVFLNALITVTQQQQPRVCFTSGHGEASIKGFTPFDLSFAAELLKQQNFETEAVEKISGQVPVRCDVLVVAGPRVPLQENEVSSIQTYLSRGGKLLYMTRTLDITGQAWSKSGLEELVASYGIRVEDAAAIDMKTAIRGLPSRDRTISPVSWLVRDGWSSKHPIGQAMAGKVMRVDSPRALVAVPRPNTDTQAILSTQSKGASAWGERDLFGSTAQYDAKRDIKGPVAVVMATREIPKKGEKKRHARIMVVGTQLLLANYKLSPNQPSFDYTKELVLMVFNWLAEQESLVALAPRRPEHVKLKLNIEQVNRIARLVVLWLPLLAVMLGLLVWLIPGATSKRGRSRKNARKTDKNGGAK
jgi:ABC-type uncharacterized transport system